MNRSKSPMSLFGALYLSIFFGVIYWFLDATIDVFLFGNESFSDTVFSPGLEQIYMRSIVFCLITVISVIGWLNNRKRMLAEKALLDSEGRFRNLLVASSDGIIIYDKDKIIETNHKFADLLGYEAQEIIGKAPKDFFDESSQQRMSQQIEGKENSLFQVVAVRKNGTTITLEFTNRTISYSGETVWIATISDCSVPTMEPQTSKEESNQYRILLRNSNDPLFVYGLTNENVPDHILEAGEMACTKLGYTAEEYAKLSIMEIIVPEERDNILPIFQTLIDFKHSIFETEILTKDNNRLPVEISSHLFDLDNRPTVISTLREISERKKANKLLHDSEKYYRRLFSKAPVAYMALDPEGNIADLNDKCRLLLGFNKEEVADAWFGDFLTRSSLDRFRATFPDLKYSEDKIEIELEISSRDKKISNISMTAEAAKNSLGDMLSVHCILLNISNQQNNKEESQKQAQWLEQIIDNASDIIFSFRPDSTITNVNPTFEKVFGKPDSSSIGSRFESMVHPDDLDFVRQAIDKCIDGETIPPIDIRLHTKSGDHIPAELTLMQFYKNNEVIGINCIAKGLSNRRQGDEPETCLLEALKKHMETFPDSACIIDRNLKILYASKNHYKLSEKLGLTKEIIGCDVINYYPFESEESRNIYSDIFDHEKTVIREVSYNTENTQLIFEAKIIPFYSGDEIAFLFLIIKDITAQKLTEMELKRSEEELSIIFNNSSAILVLVDNERRILKINKSGLKFANRLEDDILGKRGGEGLGCLNHLDDPKGCGAGLKCQKCSVRNTVLKTFETGINHRNIQAKLPFKIDGIKQDLDLLVSTTLIESKENNMVLVSLENITGQKMAERSLKQSEKSYRTLTENLPGLVYRVHCLENNRMQFFNNLVEELTGYSEQELTKGEICSLESLILEEDRPNVLQKVKDAIKSNRPFEIEFRIRNKGGEIKHFVEKGQPVFDSEGQLISIDGVIFDNTERKKVEEALYESEEKYRQIIENAAEGILIAQDEWLKFVNPQMEKFAGYTCKELLSKPFTEFIHPDDREKVIENHYKRINGELIDNVYSFRIITKNNEIKWFELGGIQITWDGKPASLNFIIDITERKQAEDILKASEKRFHDISMSSADFIWEIDANGIYTYASGKVKQLFGYEPDELIGKSPMELMPDDEAKRVGQIFKDIVSNRKHIVDLENWNLTKDGRRICLLTNGVPIVDEEGQLLGYRGVDKDITEAINAKEALKKAHDELELKVKEQTAALRKSEERLELAIEGAELGTWDWNIQTGEVIYNDRWCSILGYSPSEVEPHVSAWKKLLHPEDAEKAKEILEKNLKGETSHYECEQRLLTKSGEYKWIQGLGKVVEWDKEGNPLRHVGTEIDIDKRKQAEAELNQYRDDLENMVSKRTSELSDAINSLNLEIEEHRQTEKALRSLSSRNEAILEAVPDIIMEVDSNKVYAWANRAGYEFFGEDVIGKEASFYFEGEQDVYSAVETLFNGAENVIYIESWQRRKNGEKRLLAWWCRVLKDGDGNVTGALSTARDITEIKLAEIRLRESEEKFRSIAELTADGIVLIDKESRIVAWNNGQEKITGLSKEEVLNKPIYDIQYQLIPDNHKTEHQYQMLKSAMHEIATTGISPYANKYLETEIARPDGNLRNVEILSFPIKTSDSILVCSISRDITDKKLLEDELSKAEKLESIGVLAGGIAHDFNNILTAILGNISLAKMDTIPDSDINMRLLDAEKASERAQDLTRQLLTFSKGGAPIKKTISIRNLIKESAHFALHGSNVKGLYDIPDDLAAVDVDAGQISQVINNLIINANQAMPDGGTITISAKNENVDNLSPLPIIEGQYVLIKISDEGTGIPEDHLNRIFDPYFTTKQKGSGLGLATTYSIIKNHDGHINVESRQGEGTSFTIYLPISSNPVEMEIEEENVKASGGGKILIMDDEKAIRMVTGVALTKTGYKVDFANNGEEAVEKYKSAFEDGQPFDLIFMDLTIPGGMGGEEAMRKIKEINPNAKAIVSSGYSNNPIMADYEKYGFCGVITKPYKADNLNRIVYQVLHGSDIPV